MMQAGEDSVWLPALQLGLAGAESRGFGCRPPWVHKAQ